MSYAPGERVRILIGDCRDRLRELPDESVQCVVTSPPYFGLRDYGVDGQLGLEASPAAFVAALVGVMCEVRRVLRTDGTLWLNLGDGYARNGGTGNCGPNAKVGNTKRLIQKRNCKVPDCWGLKPKSLIGIPWRVAFALQDDGWILRSDIIWHKPNSMPESVTDRPTRAHEYVFLLAKSGRYYYDADAVREPGAEPDRERSDRIGGANGHIPRHSPVGMMGASATRNRRTVWTIPTAPYAGAHFATFPRALVETCILAGSRPGDVVLDPFVGSGTVLEVALQHGRHAIGIDINPANAALIEERLSGTQLRLTGDDYAAPAARRGPGGVACGERNAFWSEQ